MILQGAQWGHWNIHCQRVVFVISANLTPDESGLGNGRKRPSSINLKVTGTAGAINKNSTQYASSLMPWSSYRYMSDNDLHAIYAYLKSIKPVYNPIVKFTRQSVRLKR